MFPQKAIIMNGIVIQQTADCLLESIILEITNYCRYPPAVADTRLPQLNFLKFIHPGEEL